MTAPRLIFTGTPKVGKSTAVGLLSEIPPLRRDVTPEDFTDGEERVYADYGELTLDTGQQLKLIGTPGQRRFEKTWETISRDSLGVIILVDNSRPDPINDLAIYLDNFADLIERTGAAIGITRSNDENAPDIDDYYAFLKVREQMFPLFETDIRRQDDVILLIDALLATLEYGR